MHLSTKNLTSIAAMAAAFTLAASAASAQTATFTLPFTARVGNATLLPGDYRLQVSGSITPLPAAYLYREGKLIATVAVLRQLTKDTDRSHLELQAIGGSQYLRKFVSNDTGAIFTFAIPRAARHEILAETRATRVAVESKATN